MTKKSIFQRFLIGAKLGLTTPTLPDHIILLQKNVFIILLRVIGGISVILILTHRLELLCSGIYYVICLYICVLFIILFSFYLMYVNYYRIKHMYKLLKSDKLNVYNSPYDAFGSLAVRIIMCSKGFCEVAAPVGITYGVNVCVDKIEHSSDIVTILLNSEKLPFEFKDTILREMQSIEQYSKDLKQILEDIDKTSFVPGLDKFYAYLDSLTLFQESAVIHISLFIVLLLTVLNILFIFFGNEIIRYLNLEHKFPSLTGLIRLRAKFQRYSLMWNIFILVLVCVFGIFINLLVLYKVH